METDSQFLAIFVGLLALFVAYGFTRERANSKKSTGAPEPSGAWPLVGHLHLLGGQDPVARTLAAMADRCGPIFSLRLGSHRALVVSSWEMVKECFTTNDRIFVTRPTMAVGKYLGYDYASFALAPYGPYWRDMRKMVTVELLTSSRLEKLKHVRASEVEYSIKELHLLCTKNEKLTAKVRLNEWFEHLTFNISIRMLAGKRFSANNSTSKSNSEAWHLREAIKKALYLSGVFVASDTIPSIEWLDVGGFVKSMKDAAKDIDTVLGKWLDEHLQKRMVGDTDGEPDFIDVMLSTLPQDHFTFRHKRDNIIKATTMILVLTGSESTAETLIWAISLLLNNKHVLKNAQNELDAHVGREKWVEEADINNLTYFQAIVKETLRLYPPGPLAGPREAIEDCCIGGYHVPKGTRLIVNLWKLHRDSRIWSDPDEFRPERFLSENANVNFRGQNYEYIPFSSGRRMCPALTFALQVIQLALARLLQGFDLSTPMGMPVDMSEGLGIALPKVKPLEVVLTPRLPSELYHAC
ncbi:hypothetical protein RJ640_025393 [Escallonia rubra]|uniref:Cytochrome P450 82C4 n=1 Tax=Escallonia rubra TaxID=112253 RepID=A0AA88RSA4_9ASTE|nr:hypothetical protein RJ640_025393 [Escallonia rubra]